MSKTKLFSRAFVIMFILTAVLCILAKQPLIFLPIQYTGIEFLKFAVLIGFLCFCLVNINLYIIRSIKRQMSSNSSESPFYILSTLIILQVVTLLTGYMESTLTTNTADAFYYYKGVGNSLIYVITGNFTAILIASFYAKEQIRLKHAANIKFDFDSN